MTLAPTTALQPTSAPAPRACLASAGGCGAFTSPDVAAGATLQDSICGVSVAERPSMRSRSEPPLQSHGRPLQFDFSHLVSRADRARKAQPGGKHPGNTLLEHFNDRRFSGLPRTRENRWMVRVVEVLLSPANWTVSAMDLPPLGRCDGWRAQSQARLKRFGACRAGRKPNGGMIGLHLHRTENEQ